MGRPRDPSKDRAILAATVELLGETGFEQVTTRAIAQRAGTGLATIYRRWPTKEDLVVDAIADAFGIELLMPPELTDTRDRIVHIGTTLAELLQGPLRTLVPNLLGQLAANPSLAELLRSRILRPRVQLVVETLGAIDDRDVDHDLVDRVARLVPSWIFFQVLLLGETLTSDDIARHVDACLGFLEPNHRPGR